MTNLVEKILTEPVPASTAGTLFEASPVATLLFGANGATSHANAAAHRLFRCIPGELVGGSAAMLFPKLWEGSGRMSVDLGDAPKRVVARRLDGSTFAARVQFAETVFNEDSSFLATVEDLTEFDAAIADGVARVATANREFETFIDVASHDLRSPLRILTGFTEALDDECGATLNEEGKTFLKEIITASGRMEGIIDGLLSLARSSRAEMSCERLDLTTLVELVYYELRHDETERQVDCQVEPDLIAWGDVRLIMTTLRNLLGNAWKFTARSSAPVIRFYAEQRDGETWFCVNDNGAGFDMAHVGRLFKPFTRLHRQDEFPGHGIGLATAQRIVARHGGRIEAESAAGQGATVRFFLSREPE